MTKKINAYAKISLIKTMVISVRPVTESTKAVKNAIKMENASSVIADIQTLMQMGNVLNARMGGV